MTEILSLTYECKHCGAILRSSGIPNKCVCGGTELHLFAVEGKPSEEVEKIEGNLKPLLPQLILPSNDKLISKFCGEISEILKKEKIIFFRKDMKELMEIGQIEEDGKILSQGFKSIKPHRFVTLIEKYIIPGTILKSKYGPEQFFIKRSISSTLADTMLQSQIMQDAMPRIDRIFNVPIPIIYNGQLTFPNRGYDVRFKSWLPPDAPEITNPEMDLERAKDILNVLFQEFCFRSPQDKINAIAALLTPFLRGLFPTFSTRTPVFFYLANRERSGKDFCAGLTGILYEGYPTEDAPISSGETHGSNNSEELRKKVLAAMISGRKRLHFSNNKGRIDNVVFESITTAEKYSDRVLGKNEILTFDNELDFSLSGNLGITFTPDLANRCRFVRLMLDIEDANMRMFSNPDLHHWLSKNRGIVLSAMYSLVRNWISMGSPQGKLAFTSYPAWASICGGIMESAGYESPCTPDRETLSLSVDSDTMEMKQLFELCYERFPEQWITKSQVRYLVEQNDQEVFAYLDFTKKADQTKFAIRLNKYIGRIFSDIKLIVKDSTVRSSRQEIKFTREMATYSNLGNIPLSVQVMKNGDCIEPSIIPTLTTLPKSSTEQKIEVNQKLNGTPNNSEVL